MELDGSVWARLTASISRLTSLATAAAIVGGLLGCVGMWAIISLPGFLTLEDKPLPSGRLNFLLSWAGASAQVLVALSLTGVWTILGGMRSRLGTLGGFAALVWLIASVWVIVYLRFVLTAMLEPGEIPRLPIIVSYAASWGGVASTLLLAAAARRSGTMGRWWIVLIALGALELPVLAKSLLSLAETLGDAEWLVLLFGLPTSAMGLIEAVCWTLLGGTIFLSGRKLREQKFEEHKRSVEKENCHKARRLYEEAFGMRTFSVVDEMVGQDLYDHLHQQKWRKNFKRTIAELHSTFPDLNLRIEAQTAESEEVTTHCVLSGTDWGGIIWYPPTNKTATFSGIYKDRFSDGKLIEHWGEVDMLSLREQLGLPIEADNSQPT